MSLLSAQAMAAPAKKNAKGWQGYGFLPGYRQPVNNAVPLFMQKFITSEGLFWAKLSAASTMAIAPVVILGWVSQRQLVRGLSMGAVK